MYELSQYVRKRLGEVRGLRLWTPEHVDLRGALTAYRLPDGVDAPELRRGLWERYRIEAPVVERPDCLLIRASTHFYNTKEEVDRLAEALTELLPG
jgi:isopenicillin-N epimerase